MTEAELDADGDVEMEPPSQPKTTATADNSDSEDEEVSQKKREILTTRRAIFAAIEEQDDNKDDQGEDDSDEGNIHSHRPFLRLFVPSNTRPLKRGANSRDLKELILNTVGSLHKGFTKRFFAGIKPIVERLIEEEAYIPDSYYPEEEDGTPTPAEEVTPDAESTEVLQFMLRITQCVQAHLDCVLEKRNNSTSRSSHVGQTVHIITEVFDVAVLLHDILLTLPVCGPEALPLQTALVNLCETWWHANASNREQLLYILPVLVNKALGADGQVTHNSDVTRLDKIREAFYDIDFSIQSSDFLRTLLLKLASSPLCLKLKEGQRFIAFLFLLDSSFVKDLHQAIKIQIPEAKKPLLKTYGEIYKKAWKDSQNSKYNLDDIQQTIEDDVLQDLMFSVLHIEKQKMFKALLVVLEPFHEAKKSTEMEALLYRTYGPILRRALRAANPDVRINAATVLGEVFPLQNPAHADADEAFATGSQYLMELLEDKNQKVRVASAETVAKVLATYWDVLDAKKIYGLLNLVLRNASDKSAYQVRVSSLDAFSILLDCPQSHPLLSHKMLPGLCNLIHDNNKHVRLAAVNLLLKVKSIKGMSVRKLVPVEHFKARLVDEANIGGHGAFNPELYRSPVARGVTRLLLSQFMPQGPNVTAVDQIKRTISFLDNDPEAALVFYANLSYHLPTAAIAKLTAMLLRCLYSAVQTEKQKEKSGKKKKFIRKRRHDDSGEEDSGDDDSSSDGDEEEKEESLLTASNTPLMAILAEVVVALWESIYNELDYDDNEDARKVLVVSSTGAVLTNVLCYFEKISDEGGISDESTLDDLSRIRVAILQCAGYLEPQHCEGLVPHISSSLKSMSLSGKAKSLNVSVESVSNHIALLCRWEMTEDVATSLAASILTELDDGHDSDDSTLLSPVNDTSRKRKSTRGRRRSSVENANRLVPNLQPDIAIKVLHDILSGADPNQLEARDALMNTPKARETLEDALEQGTLYAGRLLRTATIHTPTMTDSHFELVVSVCEVFGRFTLHNAFVMAAEQGTEVGFNMQSSHLLEWATSHVLPALLPRVAGAPLQELDLSRISFLNESMVSLEGDDGLLSEPQTPGFASPLAPPRKKGNRNATPERLEGAFDDISQKKNGKRKDSKIIPGDSTLILVRALAANLLRTSCNVCVDWLAATGGAGSNDILKAALTWCSIFELEVANCDKENSKQNKIEHKQVQIDLLPALTRLGIELGKSAGETELFKQLLLHTVNICEETADEYNELEDKLSSHIGSTVSALLRSNATEATVDAVLAAVYKTVERLGKDKASNSDDISVEMPSSMVEVLVGGDDSDDFTGSMVVLASALQAVASHKNGSVVLAERLLENLECHSRSRGKAEDEGDEEIQSEDMAVLLFESRCLWLISDSSACRDSPRLKNVLQKLDSMDRSNREIFGAEKPVQKILLEIVGENTGTN